MRIDFLKKNKTRETCKQWQPFVDIHNLRSDRRGKALAMIKHSLNAVKIGCAYCLRHSVGPQRRPSHRELSLCLPLHWFISLEKRNRRKSSRKANVSENKITSEGRKNKSGQSGWVNSGANEAKQIIEGGWYRSFAFNEEAFKKKLSNSDRWFDVSSAFGSMSRCGSGNGVTRVNIWLTATPEFDELNEQVWIIMQRNRTFIEIYEQFSDLRVEKVAVQSEEGMASAVLWVIKMFRDSAEHKSKPKAFLV